jgi:hypothetical protein
MLSCVAGAMKATAMTNEEIKQITERVAAANRIPFNAVSTTASLDSDGMPVVEVTISIRPGAPFDFFKDGRSSRTVAEVIQKLADEGEKRFPSVHYEGTRAPGTHEPEWSGDPSRSPLLFAAHAPSPGTKQRMKMPV